MIQTPKFALAYTRTSPRTILQSECITDQHNAVTSFALANGYNIVSSMVEQRSGISASELIENIFKEHQELKFLLVYSFDRLSRNFLENIILEKNLKEIYGVTIISVRQHEIDIGKTKF